MAKLLISGCTTARQAPGYSCALRSKRHLGLLHTLRPGDVRWGTCQIGAVTISLSMATHPAHLAVAEKCQPVGCWCLADGFASPIFIISTNAPASHVEHPEVQTVALGWLVLAWAKACCSTYPVFAFTTPAQEAALVHEGCSIGC